MSLYINPFVPNAPFLYHLKTSENHKCFQGVRKINKPMKCSKLKRRFHFFFIPNIEFIQQMENIL